MAFLVVFCLLFLFVVFCSEFLVKGSVFVICILRFVISLLIIEFLQQIVFLVSAFANDYCLLARF